MTIIPEEEQLHLYVGKQNVFFSTMITSIRHYLGFTSLVQKSSVYTVSESDHIVECTTGTFPVNLPTAVGITGKEYIIKNSGSGTITVTCDGSESIDGSSTVVLSQEASLTIVSNGSNRIII